MSGPLGGVDGVGQEGEKTAQKGLSLRSGGRGFTLRGRQGLAAFLPDLRVTAEPPDQWSAVMRYRRLSALDTFSASFTPNVTSRTDAMIRDSADRRLVFAVCSTGPMEFTIDGLVTTFMPGQLIALSGSTPFDCVVRARVDPAGLLIPSQTIGSSFDHIRQPLVPPDRHQLLTRATAQFIRRFAIDASTGSRTVDPRTEWAVIGLVRSMLDECGGSGRTLADDAILVREATCQLVERHFADPEFTSDVIAAELYMSRRQLYRHFDGAEATPAALIAARRLQEARRLLSGPGPISINDVVVRCGFTSAATLRNRFRAEFGVTPSAFHAAQNAGDVSADNPSMRRIDRPGRPVLDAHDEPRNPFERE
ncbi:helix-turn-helix domain-containing protein [Gordonia sp. NPDC003504]